MLLKFFALMISCGCLCGLLRADFDQEAGRQRFIWCEDGTLEEYRVGDALVSAGADRLFAATDAVSGVSEAFAGTMERLDDGALCYRAAAPGLELGLEARLQPRDNGFLAVEATLIDLSEGRDRAIELAFSLPLEAAAWNFNALAGPDSASGAVAARPGQRYEEVRTIDNPRFTMTLSRLPFGAADDGTNGVMLAHSLAQPRFYRYAFSVDENGRGLLELKVPLGLSRDTAKFPGRAEAVFLIGEFDGAGHLRAALERYHSHAPGLFESHIGYPGAWALWIPEFSMEIARQCGMGFNQREWDEDFKRDPEEALRVLDATQRNGIKALLYSEPWSVTLPFPAGWYREHEDLTVPQFDDQKRIELGAVKRYVEELKGDSAPTERFAGSLTNDELYQILQNTAVEINDAGDWRLNCYWPGQFHWGEKYKGQDSGAVIVNPDPELPRPNRDAITYDQARYGYAWEQLEKHGRRADGFYIDSEGFSMGWSECNLRRDHWAYADLPLTYARFLDDGEIRVFQHMILAYDDFLRDMRRRADELDYSIATNTWTHFVNFLTPYGDMIGAGEFFSKDWIAPLADFREFRYSAGRKLVTTMDYVLNFEGGVPAAPEAIATYIEPRLNTYLLYGIFAGTANAWSQPEKVELLIPVMKRYAELTLAINEAGWEEQPLARLSGADAEQVLIERWGDDPREGLYFTLRGRPPHDGNVTLGEWAAWPDRSVTLEWDPADFAGAEFRSVTELLSGREIPVENAEGKAVCRIDIPAGRTLILQVQ